MSKVIAINDTFTISFIMVITVRLSIHALKVKFVSRKLSQNFQKISRKLALIYRTVNVFVIRVMHNRFDQNWSKTF